MFGRNKKGKIMSTVNHAAKKLDRSAGRVAFNGASNSGRVLIGNIVFVLIVLSLFYIFVVDSRIGESILNKLFHLGKNLGQNLNNSINNSNIKDFNIPHVDENGIKFGN